MTEHTKTQSSLRMWLIIGIIAAAITGITVVLSTAGNPKDCNCLPSGWKTIRPPNFVLALAQQGQYIWAGGPEGLERIDRLTGDRDAFSDNGMPHITYVNDLLIDGDNTLWIAHLGGIVSFKNGTWQSCGPETGLPQGQGRSLLYDKEGTLWAGMEYGAAYYDEGKWHFISKDGGLGITGVDAMYQDKDGILWFASASLSDGGLSRYDGKEWKLYTKKDGLAHNAVNAVIQDKHGIVWVGTGFGMSGGANKIENGRISTITKENGLAGEKVRSIYEDTAGNLWFGSEYDGVAVYRANTWTTITPDDGLAGWEILEIIQDSDGVLWIATENGISRIQTISQAFLRN